MLIYLLYIILCLLIGYFGKHKKFGFWGHFFCSLLLTPVIGALLVVASDDQRKRAQMETELEKTSAKLRQREGIETELKHLSAQLGQVPVMEIKLENMTTQLHQLSMRLDEMKIKLEEVKNSG